MAGGRIVVKGLAELRRDLKAADPEVDKQLKAELKDVAREVAEEAKSIAGGFRRSGDLIRGIKPSVRGNAALVRSTAVHRGFLYPARLEFGDLNRPHLVPALERKESKVVNDIEQAIDRAIRVSGL